MSRLGPGIREKNMYPAQATGWEGFLQHLYGIMLNDAYICQPELVDQLQQTTHARCVDFDGKIVVLRMRLGNKGGGFAHSKSDLQESECPPAKKIVEIQYTAG